MRLALIPPVSLLFTAEQQGYQLMLPHLTDIAEYGTAYGKWAQRGDQYVIFDNGVAEQVKVGYEQLIHTAGAFGVDEMVLPDVMGDRITTVVKVRDFMRKLSFSPSGAPCKLGLVAAGEDVDDAVKTVELLMAQFGDAIDVIYLPRMLVRQDNPYARLHLADKLLRYEKELHLLGTNPVFMKEVFYASVSQMFRGVDTSAPYNYAFEGRRLEDSAAHVSRPSNYFNREANEFPTIALGHNLEVIQGWADGVE